MYAFNDRQKQFINMPLSNGKLLGVPGGGKTRCLLGRILSLIDKNEIPVKNGFVVLAFSKLAVKDFLKKGNEMRPGVFTANNVRTIHSLSGNIVKTVIGRKSSSISTVVHRACIEIRGLGSSVRNTIKTLKNTYAIFLDEAQDISEVQYNFAKALSENLGAPLCLVGDPNQNIYAFQNGSERFLREHTGFTVSLVENYRSTPEIVDVVDACKPNEGDKIVSNIFTRHIKPELFCEEHGQIIEDIVAKCLRSLACEETVAVIGPIRKSGVYADGTYRNTGLTSITAALEASNIPYRIHYKEDGDSRYGYNDVVSDATDPKVVHILTIHKSKGLEFDNVLVVNFHYDTMGRIPTPSDVATHACLWYVAMSRAKLKLTLYVDDSHNVWPGYEKFASLALVPRRIPRLPIKPLSTIVDPLEFSWTDLLRNRVRIREEDLARLEDSFETEMVECERYVEEIQRRRTEPLPDEMALSALYGIWAEETYAHAYRGEMPPVLNWIECMLNAIVVPRTLLRHLRDLRRSLGLTPDEPIKWSTIAKHRGFYTGTQTMKIIDFIEMNRRAINQVTDDIYIHSETDLIFWEEDVVLDIVSSALRDMSSESQRISIKTMWKMCLLKWQYRNECGYRWKMDCDPIIKSLEWYNLLINKMASSQPDGLEFQVNTGMKLLPIKGVVDAVSYKDKKVIELKFTNLDRNDSHAIQAIGYAEMVGGREPDKWTVEIHNIRHGIIYNVLRKQDENRWDITKMLANACGKKIKGAVIIYDLETTGLKTAECGIIEVHMEEYQTGIEIVSTLVYQDYIPRRITEITGISKNMVLGKPKQFEVVERVKEAINMCESPAIFAHNGHRFDHKIMKRFDCFHQGVVLQDTMHSIPISLMGKAIKGERKSLVYLYESTFGKPFELSSHRAKADVIMMRRLMDVANVSKTNVF
jgi:DNA polymerase III epsilon subunit-like protein